MVGLTSGTLPSGRIIIQNYDTDTAGETFTGQDRGGYANTRRACDAGSYCKPDKPSRAGWLIGLLGLTVPAAVTYRAKAGRVDPAGWLTRWPSGYV